MALSISERRKEVEKTLEKEAKQRKKMNKKFKKRTKDGLPIIDATKKSRKKAIRKNFTNEFRREFDAMTEEQQESLLRGIKTIETFPTKDKVTEKLRIRNKERAHREKAFNKFLKKVKPKTLNDYYYAEKDFELFYETEKEKAKKKGLIVTDPLMKSIIKVDERDLEKVLKSITKKSTRNAQSVIERFDEMMYGNNAGYHLDFSELAYKDQIIEKSTKRLLKTLNSTKMSSFRL